MFEITHVKLFQSNTFNLYKLFFAMGMFHTLRTRETDSTKPQETTNHENHVSFQPTHTHTKLLKLSLGCQFIHKCCKLSGRHIWRKATLVLTHRWRQKASLGLHRSEYSAQWSFTYKLSTNEPFILKYLLTTKNWHSPKAMRQIQKGLTCGNHMTAPC